MLITVRSYTQKTFVVGLALFEFVVAESSLRVVNAVRIDLHTILHLITMLQY